MIAIALALAAAGVQDLDQLDRDLAVAAAAMGGTAIPVDRRLRLAACAQGVQIDTLDTRTLAVRCPDGWRLRVPIMRAVASIAQTMLVRRGDPVSVISGGQGFAVTTDGQALEDAALGASVRVKLDGGARQIVGMVSGAQEVTIGALKLSSNAPLSLTRRGENEEQIR